MTSMEYQQPEPQYSETSTEMRFALAVGTVAAAANLSGALYRLSSMDAFNAIILWRAAAEFLMWAGGAYVLALVVIKVLPGLPALLLQKAEDATGLDLDGKPQQKRDLPTGQPVRGTRHNLQVMALPLTEDDTEDFDDLPELPAYITRVDSMIWGDRLNINGHVLDMPQGFNPEWLYTVAEKREAGQLDTISLRALDDIKISRWGNGSAPAALVISVLEEAGCIESRGTNQPYDWTEAGRKAFPSPTL